MSPGLCDICEKTTQKGQDGASPTFSDFSEAPPSSHLFVRPTAVQPHTCPYSCSSETHTASTPLGELPRGKRVSGPMALNCNLKLTDHTHWRKELGHLGGSSCPTGPPASVETMSPCPRSSARGLSTAPTITLRSGSIRTFENGMKK